MECVGKLDSHNEWDKHKQFVVGSAEETVATLTFLKKIEISRKTLIEAIKLAKKAFPEYIMDQVRLREIKLDSDLD